jgi:hypothetical protein
MQLQLLPSPRNDRHVHEALSFFPTNKQLASAEDKSMLSQR